MNDAPPIDLEPRRAAIEARLAALAGAHPDLPAIPADIESAAAALAP